MMKNTKLDMPFKRKLVRQDDGLLLTSTGDIRYAPVQ